MFIIMNEYIYYLKLIRWAKKCPQGTLVKQTYVKANKRSCLKLNSVKQTNKQTTRKMGVSKYPELLLLLSL